MNENYNNALYGTTDRQQFATICESTSLFPMQDNCFTLLEKIRFADDFISEIRAGGTQGGFGVQNRNKRVGRSHLLGGFNCLIDVTETRVTHFPNGTSNEEAVLSIRFQNKPPISVTVPFAIIRHEPKELQKMLTDMGVVFISREAFEILRRDILLRLSTSKKKDQYIGIYVDTDGNIRLEVAYIDTAAPCDLADYLDENSPDRCNEFLDRVSDVGVAELAVALGIDPFVLTYNVSSNAYTAEDIFNIFQSKPVRLDDVDFEDFNRDI